MKKVKRSRPLNLELRAMAKPIEEMIADLRRAAGVQAGIERRMNFEGRGPSLDSWRTREAMAIAREVVLSSDREMDLALLLTQAVLDGKAADNPDPLALRMAREYLKTMKLEIAEALLTDAASAGRREGWRQK